MSLSLPFTVSKLNKILSTLLLVSTTVLSTYAMAQSETEATEEVKGPHGGKLVQHGDLDLEITVFERGVPPEMRIYAYNKGVLVTPDNIDLQILLGRLGGKQDNLSFLPEKDYLVSNQIVVEPHSFSVTVNAEYQGKSFDWQYDNFEGRTHISDRLIALSEIVTEQAKPQTLTFTDTLFGIVSPITDKVFSVNAPYNGMVEQVAVRVGDSVKKGQVLATITNSETLQKYLIKSPANAQVTQQLLNVGDNTRSGALLTLTDFSEVWLDLSAFPNNIEKLYIGAPVTVGDNHSDEKVTSSISYIAPMMTGGHIARARAVIANPEGHWRPGMHIKADVQTREKSVPLAVRVDALQTFRDMPVVFVKYGNTFEVRMVELGESDGDYIEVLGGLEPGADYVTENSFLLKADVLKDAAKHDH